MSNKPKERPLFHICTCAGGTYMINPQKHVEPPPKILMPWLIPNDPRLFVRNGELIKPYSVVEFTLERTEICPPLNHDRAFYREASRTGSARQVVCPSRISIFRRLMLS